MHTSTDQQPRREQVQALAEQLYRERYEYLLRIATKHTASREDASEAVQFALLAFVEKYDPAGRRFTAESIPSGDTSPEQLVDLIDDARTRLGTLKPAELRALSLIAAGFSYREVGQITGWSYTKTNRCATEGRAALRAVVMSE